MYMTGCPARETNYSIYELFIFMCKIVQVFGIDVSSGCQFPRMFKFDLAFFQVKFDLANLQV
jgi:hypothetical protein